MPNLNNTYQQINTSLSGVSKLFSFSGTDNLEIDAGTLTLDTATLNLDGVTGVYVKNNGNIISTFNNNSITLDTATLNLDGSTAVYVKNNGNIISTFNSNSITLDTAILNLDGSTAVYIKDNATVCGTFGTPLIEFKNTNNITLNSNLDTYIQQFAANIASFSTLESTIDSTVVKIGRNDAYNCFFGGSEKNGLANSRAYYFGVSSSSSNQEIYNYFGTTEEAYAPTNNYFGLGYHKIDSNITSMPDIPLGNLYFASNGDTELVLIYRGLDGGYRSGTLSLT